MMRTMARGWRCHGRRGAATRPARHGAVAAVLLLGLLAGGCTGDDDPGPSTTSEEPVALQIETVSGADRLDRSTRTDVEEQIGDVLSQYVVEGFLGTYPRGDFVRAYDSFTAGLVQDAAADLDVLTAASLGDAEAVRATRLDARLSLLADGDAVVGASAAIRFGFEATMPDGETRPFALRGRLLLEHRRGTWSFFGYDVTRSGDSAVAGEVS
ncbi:MULTISPECIES: hypothetical protein [unclassified Nocardioides]|uniref:hypothetical protein n=1 Tax=unclassified Nocardioides TaxID=2615069 RepID=UPI0036224DCC